MSRKLTKKDFARIWGDVSRLSVKDWVELVELRNALTATRGTETRVPREPKSGTPGGGAG